MYALRPRGTENDNLPNDRLVIAWQGLIGSEVELLGLNTANEHS
jgi:hypothetical protein